MSTCFGTGATINRCVSDATIEKRSPVTVGSDESDKMGRRGPKPQPTAVKTAKGNPGKRAINKEEPKPPAATEFEPPVWLPDVGKIEYRRLGKQLKTLGLLTNLDLNTLANYCLAFSHVVACQNELATSGTTITMETQNGSYPMTAPQFNQLMKALQQMERWGTQMGLSPSSRAGLKVEGRKTPADQLTEFNKMLD
jgi:P27 family predicted phage terminase small subunit